MAEIKKEFQEYKEFLTSKGVNKEIVEEFINKFGLKKAKSTVTVKDEKGTVVGRKCSVMGLYYPISEFYATGTTIKEVEKLRNEVYKQTKPLEKEANELLNKALAEKNPQEKLKLLADYEAKQKEIANIKANFKVDTSKVTAKGYKTPEELLQAVKA